MRLRRGTLAAQNGWELEVWDSGPGLSPEVVARLFEPFITGGGKGVGLGLAICRDLALALGGTLGVRNRAEPGSDDSGEKNGAQGVSATLFLPQGDASAG